MSKGNFENFHLSKKNVYIFPVIFSFFFTFNCKINSKCFISLNDPLTYTKNENRIFHSLDFHLFSKLVQL